MTYQRVTSERPTEIGSNQSYLETFLQSILAPPKPENENAAPAGPRNGVEFDRKQQNFPRANYQINAETQDKSFDDLLGLDDPASRVEAVRVDLVRNGYRPIPVDGKRPHLSGWQESRADELDARRWTRTHGRAANTGIVLGENLVAIDIDILDGRVSAPLLEAADALGDGEPLVRVGKAPKTLLLYRTDQPIKKRASAVYDDGENAHKVEILGDGQQFVTDGTHPDTAKPYRWIGDSPLDVPLEHLPLIDHDRLEAFMQMADEHLSRAGWTRKGSATGERKPDLFEDLVGLSSRERLSLDRCKEILSDLPAEWREDRDLWIRAGMALHDETAGSPDGFRLWDEWSRQSAKYDPLTIKRDWRSFREKSGGVTVATLIEAGAAKRAERHNANIDAAFEEVTADAKPATSKLKFLTPDDCAAMPSRGYVVKGFIAPGDVACIFGEPGAGKSMIAPFLGYMVAQGREAFGMRTKQGSVFYVPSEDETGMQMRVRALREHHGDADNFFVVRGASINTEDSLKELLSEVKRQRPALIVLDTLAAAFPGLEENSSEAMSKVVHVGKRLSQFGAAVVFIHHSTKDSNGTPRGHSVLNGALDVSMELFKADEHGVVRGRLKKNRNGPCDRDIAFRIQSHEFGIDDDGDPVTAGYCEELGADRIPPSVKMTASERAAIDILKDMGRTGADLSGESPGVSGEEWRKALTNSRVVSASDDPESRKRVMRRVVQSLFRKGVIDEFGGIVTFRDGTAADAFDDMGADNGHDL